MAGQQVHGADISHWQGKVDLAKAKSAGLQWLYHKATQGRGYVDERYVERREAARKIGLPFGAYHFAETTSSPEVQAAHFLKTSGIKPGDMRPMLDLEDTKGSSFSQMALKARTDWVVRWVTAVKKATGVDPFIYTPFALERIPVVLTCPLWVARYNNDNRAPRVPAPWSAYTVWQFTNGVVGVPKSFPGLGSVDLNTWNSSDPARMTRVFTIPEAAKPKPPPPKPKAAPIQKPESAIFKIHLAPGNNKQTAAQIKSDMAKVKDLTSSGGGILFNTEADETSHRSAISQGLGFGWTRVLDNECTIAYTSPRFTNAPGFSDPSALLLAKKDPSMAKVSPNRYLSKAYLANTQMPNTPIAAVGTHFVSEANCVHTKVRGRKWRERTFKIQVADTIAELKRLHDLGLPIIFAGDINTGKFYTGAQLKAALVKVFGVKAVTHAYSSTLDQVYLISTDEVRLSASRAIVTNTTSDHNMATLTVSALVL